MDSARLGRVLGIGTRLAAKTVVAAVDAATAPNPNAAAPAPPTEPKQPEAPAQPAAPAGAARATTAKPAETRRQSAVQGVQRGGRRFGEAVWRPLSRAGGVLWYEFTGVFFGLFVVVAATEVWKRRSAWHATLANHDEHTRLLAALAMGSLFAYFCVSSFVKAGRRARQP
ncbi:MAG: hypothetical protein KGK08_11825 [Acidobacteriota bacterium]|nr:hypothetical protein [Acidobacteriota bacterium]